MWNDWIAGLFSREVSSFFAVEVHEPVPEMQELAGETQTCTHGPASASSDSIDTNSAKGSVLKLTSLLALSESCSGEQEACFSLMMFLDIARRHSSAFSKFGEVSREEHAMGCCVSLCVAFKFPPTTVPAKSVIVH